MRLLLITTLAVLVHGYHLGVDDAAIYVPAIKRAANPSLYPFGSEFFMSHGNLSLFANLIGGSARLSHLRVNPVIFTWHALSIFLLLLACWQLACACFENEYARWSGVALVAALLSVPVAGTALVIMDPYLTARSLSTPFTIFAIACYASNKPRRAFAWLLLTALIHIQMSVYGAALIGCLMLTRRVRAEMVPAPAFGLLSFFGLPFLFAPQPAHGIAREVLFSRTYFFVSNWTWYEWTGVFAPLALLAWFSLAAPKGTTPVFRTLARTLVPFGLIFTAIALVLTFPARLENYTRLQPMRSFHLLYVIFFVLLGGLIGEYAIRRRVWRWAALFIPLAAGMWFLQQSSYPNSAHLEWHDSWPPGRLDFRLFLDSRSHSERRRVRARSKLHGAFRRGRPWLSCHRRAQ